MRKLILQIRYTIFSRSLCVRHLQTILPYSPYLHGIFTIYSNFTPHTRIYFCKAESFLLNWNLLFQFTYTFQFLEYLAVLLICLHPIDVVYIPQFGVHFFRLYRHNILYTKTIDFDICILNCRIARKSSCYFSLSNIP